MTSRINMLRSATSHNFDREKLILIKRRLPIPKDKSPQTDVFNNSFLLPHLNSTSDIILLESDMKLE